MNALREPLSYRRCLFKVGVILHGVRRGEGSVRCTNLTLFCRLYFQPSGLLQGWYLHPNSASYVSTWMVLQISPLASETRFRHLAELALTAAFLVWVPQLALLFSWWQPVLLHSPRSSCYSTWKPERSISSNVNTTFFFPASQRQAYQIQGNNYSPPVSLFQNPIKKTSPT